MATLNLFNHSHYYFFVLEILKEPPVNISCDIYDLIVEILSKKYLETFMDIPKASIFYILLI